MACPSSGEITIQKIAREKRYNNYNSSSFPSFNLSLKNLSTGTQLGAINLNNSLANRPTAFAPYAMSDFYSYNHDAASAPSVSTTSAAYSSNFISMGGSVSSTTSLSARGFVGSTSTTSPTITNKQFIKTNPSTSTGTWTDSVNTNTIPVNSPPATTTYYIRAYATNATGTAYGGLRTVTFTASGGQI